MEIQVSPSYKSLEHLTRICDAVERRKIFGALYHSLVTAEREWLGAPALRDRRLRGVRSLRQLFDKSALAVKML